MRILTKIIHIYIVIKIDKNSDTVLKVAIHDMAL